MSRCFSPFRLFVPVEFLSSSSGWIAGWQLGERTCVVAALLPPLPLDLAARLLAPQRVLTADWPQERTPAQESSREKRAGAEGAGIVGGAFGGRPRGNGGGSRATTRDGARDSPCGRGLPPVAHIPAAKVGSPAASVPSLLELERNGTRARGGAPLCIVGWWRGLEDADPPASVRGCVALGACRQLSESPESSSSSSQRQEPTGEGRGGNTASRGRPPQAGGSGASRRLSVERAFSWAVGGSVWIEVSIPPETGLPFPALSRLLRGRLAGAATSRVASPRSPVAGSRVSEDVPSGALAGRDAASLSPGCCLSRQGGSSTAIQVFLFDLPSHHGCSPCGGDDAGDDAAGWDLAPSQPVSPRRSGGLFAQTRRFTDALQRPLLWSDAAQGRGSDSCESSAAAHQAGSPRRQARSGAAETQEGQGRRRKDEEERGSDGAERREAQDAEGLEAILFHLRRVAKVAADLSHALSCWRREEQARRRRLEGQTGHACHGARETKEDSGKTTRHREPGCALHASARRSPPFWARSRRGEATTEAHGRAAGGAAFGQRLHAFSCVPLLSFFLCFEFLWRNVVLFLFPRADQRLARARGPCTRPQKRWGVQEGSAHGDSTGAEPQTPQPFFWATADHVLSLLSSLAACAPLVRGWRCSDCCTDARALAAEARETESAGGESPRRLCTSAGSWSAAPGPPPPKWEAFLSGTRSRSRICGGRRQDPSFCSCREAAFAGRPAEHGEGSSSGAISATDGVPAATSAGLRSEEGLDCSPAGCLGCAFFSSLSPAEADEMLSAPARACRIPRQVPWYSFVAPLRVLGVVTGVSLDLLIGLIVPHLLAILVTGVVLPSACSPQRPFSPLSPLAATRPARGDELCGRPDILALLSEEFNRAKASFHSAQLDPAESCLVPAWKSSFSEPLSVSPSLGSQALDAAHSPGAGGDVAGLAGAVFVFLSSVFTFFTSAGSCLIRGPPPSLFALFSRAYCSLHQHLLSPHVRWLMDNPAGFKFNPNLTSILGSLILTTFHYWNEAASVLYDIYIDLRGSSSASFALPLAVFFFLLSALCAALSQVAAYQRALSFLQTALFGGGEPADGGQREAAYLRAALWPFSSVLSSSTCRKVAECSLLALEVVLGWRGPTRGWAWGGAFFFAAAADLLLFSTAHIFYVYVVCARLMDVSRRCLFTLFSMFRGKKWNVLRHREDTLEFELDQLLMGCVLFTIIICLFPTVFIFYVSFAVIWLAILFVHSAFRLLALLARRLPLPLIVLRFFHPGLFPGSVSVLVLEDASLASASDGSAGEDAEETPKRGGGGDCATRLASRQPTGGGLCSVATSSDSAQASILLRRGGADARGSGPPVEVVTRAGTRRKVEASRFSFSGGAPAGVSPGLPCAQARQPVRQNPVTYIQLQTHPVSWGEILLPTVKDALGQTFQVFSPSTLLSSFCSGKPIHFKKQTRPARKGQTAT
ncbi:phosphatidylinositol n-acetylglucosaminyltransferase [Besnoitia besnoiti]|uniref:Phosphatidylinositol n-acetylglucosaminyltransferase n=1 Tax=Besnoitia besnoiti TaxID=94643 RepID=A0A2A9MJH0_BESBE|nr:phosphatidylinositol n-acetylglucosaminyltransferase [Besnoitia besnoiti]PFH36116.1 phosphatidylinositol n-acetylglucosaminyltransferase [Besnoitia besnoiti]